MNDTTLYDKIEKILQTDLEKHSVVIRWLAWRFKLLYEIGEKFIKDDCLTYAASLAYTTLLALAPLAAVSLSIFSSFESTREKVLGFVFKRLLPNEELAAIIEANVDTFSINATSVSVYGVIPLVIFSWWVLSTIEASFNMIWKVGRSRPVLSQFVTYWSALTFAPILITLSTIVTAQIQTTILSDNWAEYSYLQSFALKALPYMLTWVAFFLVYKLIPYTIVDIKPALVGAVVAGTMFEVAKLGFNYYLSTYANYTAIYGALAVIPIFLFWLYVTWLIVLLGAVMAYAIQYPREIKSVANEGFNRTDYTAYYALRILIEATRAFEAGAGAADPKKIQQKLQITGEFYETLLTLLRSLDFIELVYGSPGDFLLKHPPETVNIADAIRQLGGNSLVSSPEPLDQDRDTVETLYKSIRKAMAAGSEQLTLFSFAIQPATKTPASAEDGSAKAG